MMSRDLNRTYQLSDRELFPGRSLVGWWLESDWHRHLQGQRQPTKQSEVGQNLLKYNTIFMQLIRFHPQTVLQMVLLNRLPGT